jgi:hypothetical protein
MATTERAYRYDLVHALKLPLQGEPLLHFLVLGAALFVSSAWSARTTPKAPAKIVVSASRCQPAHGFCPGGSADRGGAASPH